MEAPNPDYAQIVSSVLLTMPIVKHYGFSLGRLAPGQAELIQPRRAELTQHDGLFAGVVLGALGDFAAGSAAGTLLPAGWVNMTIDYTVKIMAPAGGDQVVARGRVINAGRTTSIAAAELYSCADGEETLCATTLVTLRNVKLPRG
ncbi:MAG TPA: PaaI family thioesterase [Amycolatopsis sp.]|nr:PaaI family thioesterase [Amycolatopsis sp.]